MANSRSQETTLQTADPSLLNAAADSFRLLADTRQRVERIAHTAREAVRQHYKTPEAMKAFIEEHGTPVYVIPSGLLQQTHAQITLKYLGFAYGYIARPGSEKGRKRYQKLVSWLTRDEERSPIYFDESRFEQGVFVLQPEHFNVPFLSLHLHHWMACRAGLQGYSENAQALYQKFWNEHNGEVTPNLLKKLDVSDIIELKQAINRDMEALAFLRQMVDEIFVPANQMRNQLSK